MGSDWPEPIRMLIPGVWSRETITGPRIMVCCDYVGVGPTHAHVPRSSFNKPGYVIFFPLE